MKKKVIFGLGALVLAAMLTLNLKLVKDGQNCDLTIGSLVKTALANEEGSATVPCIDATLTPSQSYPSDRVCLDGFNNVICSNQHHFYSDKWGTCTITN